MLVNIFFVLGTVLFSLLLCIIFSYHQQKQKDKVQKISEIFELLFWSGTCCFLECTIFTFILALCGVFSLFLITIILWCQISCMLVIVFCRIQVLHLKNIILNWNFNKILFFLIAISIIFYFLFPTEYLWARRDPALYVIKGVNIAQSGSVNFNSNEYLNENYDSIKDFTDLTYRGVYSDYEHKNSDMFGDISVQFLDFFPASLALGYSAAGLDGLFRVNGFIGILCLLAIYYFCKYCFNRNVATIATVFMTFCPAQLWCARITQSELLYQLCWILGLYTFAVGWNNSKKGWAVLSGGIIGFIGLNRIDSYILGVGVLAVVCYCNLFIRKKAGLAMCMAISYSLAAGISFLYSYIFSYYYVMDHWNIGVLSALIYLNIFMLFMSAVTFVIGIRWGKPLDRINFMYKICESPKWRLITCCLMFLIMRLVYYARPLLQKGENVDWDFNQRAFMEFCWYTSVAIIPLLILGVYFLMKDKEKRRGMLLLIATGLCSLIVYIWKPSVAPDHIWASRRWVSTCIPFVFIIAAYGIDNLFLIKFLKKTTIKVIQVFTTLVISTYLLYQCRIFIFTPMLTELQGQYEVMVGNMEDRQVYFAQMSHFASILRFVYGQDVFVIKEDSTAAMAEYASKLGEPIYYIGEESFFDEKLSYKKLYDGKIMGLYLKQVNGKYPTELIQVGAETNIYIVWASGDNTKLESDRKKGK